MPAARQVNKGDRFGRLVFVEEASPRRERNGSSARQFIMQCDCGERVVTTAAHVYKGNTRSCGCLKRDVNKQQRMTHGMRGTPIYGCWLNMTYRSSPRCKMPAYANVGRDPRWDSFENFYADMGPSYFPHAQLGRIGDTGDYGPTNARWVTAAQNNAERNKRV